MFWNDPNLYSVAFKDIPSFPNIPNIPPPYFGMTPRLFNPYPVTPNFFTPQVAPHLFNPQVPPTFFNPQVAPHLFNPQVPPAFFTPQIAPYLQTPTMPFINPMMAPYGYTLPYFQGYRPFGL